jgi:hypothetical protein
MIDCNLPGFMMVRDSACSGIFLVFCKKQPVLPELDIKDLVMAELAE